ncbi:MAG: ABC transporter ATP-binding protein [Candidatus Bathyarchaeia archaeon]
MTEDVLKVNEIHAYYGKLKVLENISLTIGKDEIVGIIGANGAGKSSLLNTIMGVIHPRKGNILFENKDITFLEPNVIVDLGISLVPERRRIFPDLTVFENLKIGAYIPRARKYWKDSMENVFDLFPILKERKNQIAKTLSGGEQQMLAIGRALMSKPKLILFDEISLGLAPKVVEDLYKAIRKINSEGIPMIIVEQYMDKVFGISSKIFILRRGIIEKSGKPDQLDISEIRKAYFGL